tara:strand:+ start:262 stop:609 length:348 start_codon:yes stop_codon:yes gene_type:complete
MILLKFISSAEYFKKKSIYFFLMFFFINIVLNAKADENKYIIKNKQEEHKLKEFYSQNAIKYNNHDKLASQLKMFFGFDPENPETSFYPELLIIEDSDSVRDMYKLQLNEMSIKK